MQRPAAPPVQRAAHLGRDAAAIRAPSRGNSSTGFSASKLFAIDVEEFAHDPELEEAAIRFANGDDAGAEAGLLRSAGPEGRAHRSR